MAARNLVCWGVLSTVLSGFVGSLPAQDAAPSDSTDAQAQSKAVFSDAVALWHLRDLRDSAADPVELRVVGSSRTGVALDGADKAASLSRHGDGFIAVMGNNGSLAADPPKSRFPLDPITLAPGGRKEFALTVDLGEPPDERANVELDPKKLAQRAEAYWRGLNLPHGRIVVPDATIQGLVDAGIRNILQSREIKGGKPVYQPGVTVLRHFCLVDSTFMIEALLNLGRERDARIGIDRLLYLQKPDGGCTDFPRHWKETGIVLWSLSRYARLTGNRNWVEEVWPSYQKAFAYIINLRKQAPGHGLLPDGFGDAGLIGVMPEYSNLMWTFTGLRTAIETAHWLGKEDDAKAWQRDYDDFQATFRKVARRDMKTDAEGNRYLPVPMKPEPWMKPQLGQWAFMQAVFPGRVFPPGDAIAEGTMAAIEAGEREGGVIIDMQWVRGGITTFYNAIYGQAWLWMGQRDKAIKALYSMANHAAPTLGFREEQMPKGQPGYAGDMPGVWGGTLLTLFIRHMLALEREDELHLLEALPREWVRPGAKTALRNIHTNFGILSLELQVSKDGRKAMLRMTPPQRERPRRIVLHLDGWSGRQGTIDLPTDGPFQKEITLKDTPLPRKQYKIDFEYAPHWWQTLVCLKDDPHKTLLGKRGTLLHEWKSYFVSPTGPGGPHQFIKTVSLQVDGPMQWLGQDLPDPTLPEVRTRWRCGDVAMTQRAFAIPEEKVGNSVSPRQDVIIVDLRNTGDQPATVAPIIEIKSQRSVRLLDDGASVRLGWPVLHSSLPLRDKLPAPQNRRKLTLDGEAMSLHVRLCKPTGEWANCGIVSKFCNPGQLIYNLHFKSGDLAFELGTTEGVSKVGVPVDEIGRSEWHDVTVRYDGAKLEMFVDGKRVAETAASGTLRPENKMPVVLGGDAYNGEIRSWFGGLLDTVALWKRALTDSEIRTLGKKKREKGSGVF